MKKFVIVANDAPQTGKTSFTNVLAETYERRGISAQAIFTDHDSAPTDHAFWDLEGELEADRVLTCFEETDVLIADVASGDTDTIIDFFNNVGLYDLLVDVDIELCVAIAVNNTEAAFESTVTLAEGFADNADYLLLRGPHMTEGEETAEWSGSYAEKVSDYVGATEIQVPEFDAGMMGEIWDQGKCLATALASRKELPRYLREAVHSWELKYSDAISDAEELLTPDTSGSRSSYGSTMLGH